MRERMPASAPASPTARRTVKLAMATVLVSLAPVLPSRQADAQESVMADSDGYVPTYYSCFAGGGVGYYGWYNDGYATYGEITVDSCLLDSLGAGPADYERVLAHEQGHAAGLVHSSDPNDAMYPYAYVYQEGGETIAETPVAETPVAEQYIEPEQPASEDEQYAEPGPEQPPPEDAQYEEPETEQPPPENAQYALDLSSEIQQYDPGQEADDAGQEPAIREAPRKQGPTVRSDDQAEERKKAEEKKKAEERKKAEEKKRAEERDQAVDRVRTEAAALARAVSGADALAKEEPGDRAEALAKALGEGEIGAKDGPLAESRTKAEEMAESLTTVRGQADAPARDRAKTVAETREQAEALAGTLDRAGDDVRGDARAKDFEEASAEARNVASELARAEKEFASQGAEEGQGTEARSTEAPREAKAQDTEQGFFASIRAFFARTFG